MLRPQQNKFHGHPKADVRERWKTHHRWEMAPTAQVVLQLTTDFMAAATIQGGTKLGTELLFLLQACCTTSCFKNDRKIRERSLPQGGYRLKLGCGGSHGWQDVKHLWCKRIGTIPEMHLGFLCPRADGFQLWPTGWIWCLEKALPILCDSLLSLLLISQTCTRQPHQTQCLLGQWAVNMAAWWEFVRRYEGKRLLHGMVSAMWNG